MDIVLICLPLLIGWGMDLLFGDPVRLPHPIVWFGKVISFCDRYFNKGKRRKFKGLVCALSLILCVYILSYFLLNSITNRFANIVIQSILIFYCLSGSTLIKEVKNVFKALDSSLTLGQKQVARIVGRDTPCLSDNEVRTAALETLAENLSDGVVAPVFWYALLGVPGMLAYKMVNTLDSMVGYKNDKYKDFGWASAKIDDLANFLPSRITSLLMLISWGKLDILSFVRTNGSKHLSPNSGYPEAALAGILDCRFGGPHFYFGQIVDKPFIGDTIRSLSADDLKIAVIINRRVEFMCIILALIVKITTFYISTSSISPY